MKLDNGDIVFFKKFKTSSNRRSPEIGLKGHGFGVFLGHVPPFQKDPPPALIAQFLGQSGLLTFDDVAEFLGEEVGAKCVKMFEDKYYGKKIVEAVPAPEAPSGLLVDTNGAPLGEQT